MDLNGKALSASMINTFLDCRRKFQKRYVERLRPKTAADHLALGSAFHAAMEEANLTIQEGGPLDKFTDEQKEQFLHRYRIMAVKFGLNNMKSFEEGLDLVETALERTDPKKKVLGVELEFNIETPDGVPIMGYIDEVIHLNKQELLISDYKTSRIAKSTDEAEHDVQLAMYDYAASVMFPQYRTIWVQLDYVRFDKPPVKIKRNKTKRQNFLKFLKAVHEEMLAFEPDPDQEGTFNQYCAYCDYATACNEYVTQLNNYDLNLKPVEHMDSSELVTELDSNNNRLKALEARTSQLKLHILNLKEKETKPIRNEDKEVYLQQNTTRVQDVPTVLQNMTIEDLLGFKTGIPIVGKINNKGIDAHFKKFPNKKLQMLIDSKAEVKYSNPSVRTKKAK